MTPFRLAFLSITRQWISSVIAVTAIALSVSCSGILYRLYLLSESRFSRMALDVDAVVGAKSGGIDILLGSLNLEGGYPGFVPSSLFETLKQGAPVKFEDGAQASRLLFKEMTPVLFFAKYKDYRVFGSDLSAERFRINGRKPLINELVVGSRLAIDEGLSVGDDLDLVKWPGGGHVRLRVSGVLGEMGSAWDWALVSDLSTAQTAISMSSIWGQKVLNYFVIQFNDKTIEFPKLESLINQRTVAQVIDVKREKTSLIELTGAGKNLGFFISVMVMLLGALAVAGVLITRFEGMKLNLAVLRALGYTKQEIASGLMIEGLLLGVPAALIGGIIDFIFFPLIRAQVGQFGARLLNAAEPSIMLSTPVWVASVVATIAAVIGPMARLYRQDVHDALKGQ